MRTGPTKLRMDSEDGLCGHCSKPLVLGVDGYRYHKPACAVAARKEAKARSNLNFQRDNPERYRARNQVKYDKHQPAIVARHQQRVLFAKIWEDLIIAAGMTPAEFMKDIEDGTARVSRQLIRAATRLPGEAPEVFPQQGPGGDAEEADGGGGQPPL